MRNEKGEKKMAKVKKVFCSKCTFFGQVGWGGSWKDGCRLGRLPRVPEPHGKGHYLPSCYPHDYTEKNKDNDCKDYKKASFAQRAFETIFEEILWSRL